MNVVRRSEFREDRGAALFASLALLLIFSVLGTAYVKSMTISLEDTRYEIKNVRANHLSRGGIYAGIGEIQAALEKGEQPAGKYEIALTVYRMLNNERASYPQIVQVTVRAETGSEALSSGSRSFRLVSEVYMKTGDTSGTGLHSAVEAVAHFASDGSFSIRYWNETPSEEVFVEAEAAAPAPVDSAGDDAVDDNSEVTEEPEDAGTESE